LEIFEKAFPALGRGIGVVIKRKEAKCRRHRELKGRENGVGCGAKPKLFR
jgi:hypothetical protein